MKYLFSTLCFFFIFQSSAQITILGAKKTEIIETNNDKNDVKEIKNINFSKTDEEIRKPNFISTNYIGNSNAKLVDEKVEINIINQSEIIGDEKKQLVVDLDKAKETVDSVKVFKNPNYFTNENESNSIQESNLAKPSKIYTDNTAGNSSNIIFLIKEKVEVKENITSPNEEINSISIQKTETESKSNINTSKSESGITFSSTKNNSKLNSEYLEFEEENIENNTKTELNNKSSESKIPSGNLNKINNLNDISSDKPNTEKLSENNSNPKKGSWSVGLKVGIPIVIGDVNSKAGYGFSLNVQKALGHVFALRFEALALETKGLNNKRINNTFHNYKTRFTDYTLQGVFTLNNLNFYKKEPKVLYNIVVGGGLATRYTWTDVVDANGNAYNYDNISGEKASDITKAINDLRDKNYETSIVKDGNKMSIKNTNILPTIMLGLGVDIKLTEKIDLNLATRFSHHFDDNLDGLQNGNTADWMSFTSLGVTYKFGSKNNSMLWTNPVYSKVEEINELKKKVKNGDLLKDEDKDGIADIFDQDLNTPPKVAVDSRGIPSDLDKDGVPDYEDAEPFTPLGANVDKRGIAIDSDNDGISDALDLEPNTLSGSQVDSRGKTIIPSRNEANDLSIAETNSDFELIFFDENSSNIKREFYSNLYNITKYIKGNPTAKIEIIGYTDVTGGENFNLNLSEKRANAVYSMLIEMFKIPANNLSTRFEGENNPIIEGLPKTKNKKFEAAYYINRRVEFKISQ